MKAPNWLLNLHQRLYLHLTLHLFRDCSHSPLVPFSHFFLQNRSLDVMCF